MRQYFGWSKTSEMPSVYAHLSQKNIDNSLRQALGLEEDKEKEIRCRICGTNNSGQASSCVRCGNALTIEGSLKMQQKNKFLEEQLAIIQAVNSKVLELVRAGQNVDFAEKEAINVVAKNLLLEEGHTNK
jgi:ribosomal protein L40E